MKFARRLCDLKSDSHVEVDRSSEFTANFINDQEETNLKIQYPRLQKQTVIDGWVTVVPACPTAGRADGTAE